MADGLGSREGAEEERESADADDAAVEEDGPTTAVLELKGTSVLDGRADEGVCEVVTREVGSCKMDVSVVGSVLVWEDGGAVEGALEGLLEGGSCDEEGGAAEELGVMYETVEVGGGEEDGGCGVLDGGVLVGDVEGLAETPVPSTCRFP